MATETKPAEEAAEITLTKEEINIDAAETAAPEIKEKKQKAPQQKPVADDGFSVYLGPSIRAVIQSGTIYPKCRSAVLKELKSVIDKYPLIASLIVSGDKLPESRVKIKTPGNLLYKNYSKFADVLKVM